MVKPFEDPNLLGQRRQATSDEAATSNGRMGTPAVRTICRL
jgi:hypothetical protein